MLLCPTHNMETKINNGHSHKRACKIRKRVCSSSSSSSLVRRYRFKRAILAGKRARGSSTPVKTVSGKSPVSASPGRIPPQYLQDNSTSVRKLAATLRDINGVPSRDCLRDKKEMRNGVKTEISSPDVSDPNFSPVSEKDAKSRGDRIHRTSVVSHKLQVIDYNPVGSDSLDMKTYWRGRCRAGIKSRLEDVINSLTTSKELVKLLIHVHDLDDKHPMGTMISALKFELARARSGINHLIKDHRSSNNEIECIIKGFSEEKSLWKQRERERTRDAIAKFSREVAAERKIRKQTERLNKKLGKELAEAKNLLARVAEEMDSEKRAKEILEQVCDELARGIGEDKAEVEKLKRENGRIKEEVEKEREMMQIADVLREERVQMKLTEAKYQFEEKNAVVENLKNELEAYLRSKNAVSDEIGSPGLEKIKLLLEKDDESDEEEDLHSIELNMDPNSRSYKWNFDKKTPWEEEVESERDKSLKGLRDYILSSVKIASDASFPNQPLFTEDGSSVILDDSSRFKRKGSTFLPRTSTSSTR